MRLMIQELPTTIVPSNADMQMRCLEQLHSNGSVGRPYTTALDHLFHGIVKPDDGTFKFL
jgi:hypothetical protein